MVIIKTIFRRKNRRNTNSEINIKNHKKNIILKRLKDAKSSTLFNI